MTRPIKILRMSQNDMNTENTTRILDIDVNWFGSVVGQMPIESTW